jgi:hypothetical protein
MSYESPTCEELARDTLLRMMREISEDCWCAGWLTDLEFTLWSAVTTGKMESGWGVEEERDLLRMKYLHELTGGWWIWASGEQRERFVPMDEWLAILSERAVTRKESK